jgi:hypothetical protein
MADPRNVRGCAPLALRKPLPPGGLTTRSPWRLSPDPGRMRRDPGGNMPETHHGGCHCGAVRYRVDIDLSKPVTQCNCSICGRSGTLLSFVPAQSFTLEKGEESLTDYQFNKKNIHHLFCKVCGVRSFARGKGPSGPMVAINTRCLDEVDASTLNVQHFDGKSR